MSPESTHSCDATRAAMASRGSSHPLGARRCQPRNARLKPARCRQPGRRHPQHLLLHVLHILRVLRVLRSRHPGLPRTPQVPPSVPARPARAYLPARHTARHTHHRVRRARSVGAPVQQSPACHPGPVSRWCPLLVPLYLSVCAPLTPPSHVLKAAMARRQQHRVGVTGHAAGLVTSSLPDAPT